MNADKSHAKPIIFNSRTLYGYSVSAPAIAQIIRAEIEKRNLSINSKEDMFYVKVLNNRWSIGFKGEPLYISSFSNTSERLANEIKSLDNEITSLGNIYYDDEQYDDEIPYFCLEHAAEEAGVPVLKFQHYLKSIGVSIPPDASIPLPIVNIVTALDYLSEAEKNSDSQARIYFLRLIYQLIVIWYISHDMFGKDTCLQNFAGNFVNLLDIFTSESIIRFQSIAESEQQFKEAAEENSQGANGSIDISKIHGNWGNKDLQTIYRYVSHPDLIGEAKMEQSICLEHFFTDIVSKEFPNCRIEVAELNRSQTNIHSALQLDITGPDSWEVIRKYIVNINAAVNYIKLSDSKYLLIM